MFRVEFTEEAAAQVEALPRRLARLILRRIEALAADPRPPHSRQLAGHDHLRRIRSGDYRILYEVSGTRLLVLVVRVAPRGDVYRRLPSPRSE
jgi:mRNA interferase RelE/StbE